MGGVRMKKMDTPEKQTPEIRYSAIAGLVKAWAKENGVDYKRPNTTQDYAGADAGVWQTPDGEKFHVYASSGAVSIIRGDEGAMKKYYTIELGETKKDQGLKYAEGLIEGIDKSVKVGRYGRERFPKVDDTKPNTDVFQPMEEMAALLKTAHRAAP